MVDEFNYPSISMSAFVKALDIYLNNLEDAMNKEESFWENVNPFDTSPKGYTDKLREEILSAANVEGIGPWIPHYDKIIGERVQRFDRKQAQEFYEKEARDAIDHQIELARLGLSEQNAVVSAQATAESQRLAREKFDFQKQQANRQFQQERTDFGNRLQESQRVAENYRQRAGALQMEWGLQSNVLNEQFNPPQDMQRAEMGRQWDMWRNSLGANKDRNYFQIREAAILKNPYTVTQSKNTQAELTENIKFSAEQVKGVYADMKDPNNPLTPSSLSDPKTQMDFAAISLIKTHENLKGQAAQAQLGVTEGNELGKLGYDPLPGEGAIGFTPNTGISFTDQRQFGSLGGGQAGGRQGEYIDPGVDYWKGQEMRRRAAGIGETPKFLQQFVPGLTGRIPFESEAMGDIPGTSVPMAVTPSPQQFGALTPSQKRVWGSYVDYAGGNAQDLLASAQRQIPRRPTLGRSFRPVRA